MIENAEIDLNTNTVTVDGKRIEDAEIVTEQFVPMGPAASQVAIKQSGTNGGGYMGVNSAHPLENPNAFTNLIEMLSILLIPAALCFTFGKAVKNKNRALQSLWRCLYALCWHSARSPSANSLQPRSLHRMASTSL